MMASFSFRLLLLALAGSLIILIDAYFTGVAALCMVIAYILPSIVDYEDELLWSILFPVMLTLVVLIQLVHRYKVIEIDGEKALVTYFYPLGRVVKVGERVDTLNVAYYFSQDDTNNLEVVRGHLYRLSHADNTTTLFTPNRILLTGKAVTLVSRYYKYGWIDTIEYTDYNDDCFEIDLLGNDINALGYFPQVVRASSFDYYPQ